MAESFETKHLPTAPDVVAPDGSQVRILLGLAGCSMAHFALDSGETSKAVVHATVEEIWYVLAGRGEMWRQLGDREEVVELRPGVAISLPVGTRFQFRAHGPSVLEAIGSTFPPWPGDGEATVIEGPWRPTVAAEP